MFTRRFYRDWVKQDRLAEFSVKDGETDLLIRADRNLAGEAQKAVAKYRQQLSEYGEEHPVFLRSLSPCRVDSRAPLIIREMARVARLSGVGPMAAVAGALAEFVGKELLKLSNEVLIENGGDLFIKSKDKRLVSFYAGASPFTHKLRMEISPEDTPLGISTSSGTIGHSLSFGKADAATVISPSAVLADACATAVGNIVKDPCDFNKALDFARSINGVKGVLIVVKDKMVVWGEVKLVE